MKSSATRRLRHRHDRRAADRPGARARRRALRHEGAEPVHQQGAARARPGSTPPRPNATATGTRTCRSPARTRRRRERGGLRRRRTASAGAGGDARPRAAARSAPVAAPPSGRSKPADRARKPPPLSSATGSDPFTYFVQAGAYARSEDAEQQRAKLAMIGVESPPDRTRAGRPHRLPGARRPVRASARTPTRRRTSCTKPASNRRWCACRSRQQPERRPRLNFVGGASLSLTP